jgi:hypothetical protein
MRKKGALVPRSNDELVVNRTLPALGTKFQGWSERQSCAIVHREIHSPM